MSFPYFISPEQAMRERSELARKGIARGRSVVALAYAGGVLFVAENPSRSLQKISELYDRVGFAAAGKFNEFDNLRRGGIQFADTRGYAYDRRDVTGRQLANVYAQTLGTIFTEQAKPYEVELCVAEVAHYGETKPPELYRILYDGSIADEPHFVVMGGTTEPIATALKDTYTENADLSDAVRIAVEALRAGSPDTSSSSGGSGGDQPTLGVASLEVAVLDANRPRRAFRRITGAALDALLPQANRAASDKSSDNGSDKGSDKSSDKGSDKNTDKGKSSK
ncbi:proteasome subunit alpha [Mycobacterium saskatchewanense]|uniref:Proteasome subunit alpha n=2 Tax=Mycobacteriaceae TaxID=1762 RepID=A0A1X2CF13_9MYCO|nr:proteasome subunit alpha [Mycobacterium saskatchewanense]ORW74403.1 proteasome subunit alpha [Mycobacterium saskatchewanense]BBX61871.1 proteasome subunit alpha [Mycobacterium saskatchewanense]